jgi:hypothetical protein
MDNLHILRRLSIYYKLSIYINITALYQITKGYKLENWICKLKVWVIYTNENSMSKK